jgi:lambda repressor-like predicted transcriptional regulator
VDTIETNQPKRRSGLSLVDDPKEIERFDKTLADTQIAREIKSGLALKGITLADLGRSLGCSRQNVWHVARGLVKAPRIRQAITEAIGRDPWADLENQN